MNNRGNLLDYWKKKKRSGHYKRYKAKQVDKIIKTENLNVNNQTKNILPSNSFEVIRHYETERQIVCSTPFPASNESSTSPASNESSDLDELEYFPTQNNELNHSEESVNNKDAAEVDCVEGEAAKFNVDQFSSELVCWAIKRRINNVQFRGLLEIWNNNMPLTKLPRDPRTLLRTPRMVDIFTDPENQNEKYWYYGVRKSLMCFLPKVLDRVSAEIKLNIHVDGLPISDSSNECFWPIMYNIHDMPEIPPQVISIFHGKSKFDLYVSITKHNFIHFHYVPTEKPSNLMLYLGRFVDDLNDVTQNGLNIGNRLVHVKIRCLSLIRNDKHLILTIFICSQMLHISTHMAVV